ncbi:hypothetical protein G7Z17_g2517 [Cylindrodendrum hubeiense]|uniref:DUF1446 domain-containing protein n=1 Tax=Cylindrodendrum hubeiense TaxID=595255 RepID=A0A9P5LBL7_9HYPO|nr:hypothetical protein G7Z17_g2517 [Cylindrodendrum hubeiense]
MAPEQRRPIRIGNCAGAACDAGYQMLRQCEGGPIDVVTGDYLAEANLAQNVDKFKANEHNGYEINALEGLKLSLEVAVRRRIRLVINGGALNPEGLARAVASMAREKDLKLKIGWVTGDDVLSSFKQSVNTGITHLDGDNEGSYLVGETVEFLKDPEGFEIVSAHAYLGARAIKAGLDRGCDIIVCGRVSDASPVIGAAWWWHGWTDSDFNQLAGSLVAGHLIECSGYGSGGNFCNFFQLPQGGLVDIGFPIAEIHADGSSVITKHDGTRGFVTADILKAQLVYEIQGNIYLHSDCKADLSRIEIEDQGFDRVRVSGTKGYPPPPTTKVAAFYRGGWQCEYTLNATGYATVEKFKLHESQIRFRLKEEGEVNNFQVLEFQHYGKPGIDPKSQLSSTTGLRVFGQAREKRTVEALGRAMLHSMLQHYAGMHGTLDWRLLEPKQYLSYCPCLMPQAQILEEFHLLEDDGGVFDVNTGTPSLTEELGNRLDYDTVNPSPLSSFSHPTRARLGDLVLARSGDKGANLNIGLFVRKVDEWEWLRSFLDHERMKQLMADEWDDSYKLERCELPGIYAVHFVIYGILKRGVSSSARLDALGKGFAEFIRDRWVELPSMFVERYSDSLPFSHSTIAS